MLISCKRLLTNLWSLSRLGGPNAGGAWLCPRLSAALAGYVTLCAGYREVLFAMTTTTCVRLHVVDHARKFIKERCSIATPAGMENGP